MIIRKHILVLKFCFYSHAVHWTHLERHFQWNQFSGRAHLSR